MPAKKKTKARARKGNGDKILAGLQEALNVALDSVPPSPRATTLAVTVFNAVKNKQTPEHLAQLIDSALRNEAARGEVKGIENATMDAIVKQDRQIIGGFRALVLEGNSMKVKPRTMLISFDDASVIARHVQMPQMKATEERPVWRVVASQPADVAERMRTPSIHLAG